VSPRQPTASRVAPLRTIPIPTTIATARTVMPGTNAATSPVMTSRSTSVTAPPIADDPQARLLTQMQGVIAEYERAKTTGRFRRGKLYRVRAGEAIFWKVPYGCRHVPRTADGPARLEIYEPEVEVRKAFMSFTPPFCLMVLELGYVLRPREGALQMLCLRRGAG
jgi:hypothetical protein